MTNEELVVERDEGLAIVRLNRPERLNALSAGILRRMETEVPRLVAAPDVRAIMITGTGRALRRSGYGRLCGRRDGLGGYEGLSWLAEGAVDVGQAGNYLRERRAEPSSRSVYSAWGKPTLSRAIWRWKRERRPKPSCHEISEGVTAFRENRAPAFEGR